MTADITFYVDCSYFYRTDFNKIVFWVLNFLSDYYSQPLEKTLRVIDLLDSNPSKICVTDELQQELNSSMMFLVLNDLAFCT